MDNRCRCSTTFLDPIFWVSSPRCGFLPLHFFPGGELSCCLRTGSSCPRQRWTLYWPVASKRANAPTSTKALLLQGISLAFGKRAQTCRKSHLLGAFWGFCRTTALQWSASYVQWSWDDREVQVRQIFREMTLYERGEQFCFMPNPKVLDRVQWLGRRQKWEVSS